MKSRFSLILLCMLSIQGIAQSDLSVGTSYHLNLQRQNNHADAWILHNAEYSSGNDLLKWKTTSSNFGYRGIRFAYSTGRGIYFYAQEGATTAGTEFTPVTRFFIGNDGKLGVGTTMPASLLHIENASPIITVKSTQSTSYSGINLVGDLGFASLALNAYGSAYSGGAYNRANGVSLHTTASSSASAGISIAARNPAGYITFHTGGDTEKVRIAQNGNTGIGLSTPEGKLHVKGVAYFGNENGNSWHRIAIGGSGSNYGSIGYGYKYTTITNEHTYSVTSAASQLRFDEGGFNFLTAPLGNLGSAVPFTTAMTIKQNGEINIGASNTITTGYGSKVNFLGASSNGDPLWFSRYNNGVNFSELRVNIGDDNGGDMFVVGNHYWSENEWRPHLAVVSNGNVGIGTTNPDAKLAVKGTVHAEEVKVDLNVPGPDYVFEPTYQLPSLTEIESYIKANKHLPEVPSAKEMETNGINLSEMNMLLLKKVEELTLHLIEQKKEINELRNEIRNTQNKK